MLALARPVPGCVLATPVTGFAETTAVDVWVACSCAAMGAFVAGVRLVRRSPSGRSSCLRCFSSDVIDSCFICTSASIPYVSNGTTKKVVR